MITGRPRPESNIMDKIMEDILNGPWYENGETWLERQLNYIEDPDDDYEEGWRR